MSSKRARKHKYLVNSEKQWHHRPGMHLSQHRKIRCKNLARAVCAGSVYEWYMLSQSMNG